MNATREASPARWFCLSRIGCLLGFSTAVVSGCQRQPAYTLVPVHGTLQVDGEPAANVLVQFMPDASRHTRGPSSVGITDPAGQFELMTVDQDTGAAVGSHVVVLYDLDEDRPEQGEESQRPARFSARYGTEQGGLRIAVAAGRTVDLEITAASPLDDPAWGDSARFSQDEPLDPLLSAESAAGEHQREETLGHGPRGERN